MNAGEEIAAKYISSNFKWIHLDSNFRRPFGEIDLIFSETPILHELHFIEVKYWKNIIDDPLLCLNKKRIGRYRRTAEFYLVNKNLNEIANAHFDFIFINSTTNAIKFHGDIF